MPLRTRCEAVGEDEFIGAI